MACWRWNNHDWGGKCLRSAGELGLDLNLIYNAIFHHKFHFTRDRNTFQNLNFIETFVNIYYSDCGKQENNHQEHG